MKNLLSTLLIVAAVSTFAQDSSELHGKWMMSQVIQNDKDVSSEHNPSSDRFIIFKEDGTFESGGSPYGKNTGKYFFDKTKGRVMLDSDAGENDDSMWEVTIKKDEMTWQGIGSEWAEAFKIIHKKS